MIRNRVKPTRILIMGAAGRDFHNFNMVYRNDPGSRVIAFTAAQIPRISGRLYPASLAGSLYPDGIPIIDESELGEICAREQIDQVIFAYSDVDHTHVMHKGSIVLAAGADFLLLGPERTMLRATIPVIGVSSVRTGCGKSQVTRWLSRLLKQHGVRAAVIRHPMPYGDLEHQAVQRFACRSDLDHADCTIEEREEYEPHIAEGNVVFAGIDYQKIVALAEQETDVILWDGGNNDFPFIRPDLHIVLVDPLRPGCETSHHPGEAVLRMADIIVVAKANSAGDTAVQHLTETVAKINKTAVIVQGNSPVCIDEGEKVRGKRVLVVEDGPTITHGGMAYGAGYVGAVQAGAAEIVDPRVTAAHEINDVYRNYPHIGSVLPAVGYHPSQLQALQMTINSADADIVVTATPCELTQLIKINKPVVRVRYEFQEKGEPRLSHLVKTFLIKRNLGS